MFNTSGRLHLDFNELRNKVIYLLLFGLILFGVSVPVKAQNTPSQENSRLSSEAIDTRNRIEKEIQQNLKDLIQTQLASETFSVAVRVQLKVVPPPKKEEKKEQDDENWPLGLDLGALNANELVKSYEKEIQELKILKDQALANQLPTQFQLEKIEVIVGLDDRYPANYISEFKNWLNQKLKRDYGKIAVGAVNQIKDNFREKPVNQKEKAEEDAKKDQALKDHQKELIKWLGYAALVIGASLIIMSVVLRSGLKQVATANKPISLENKGELLLKGEEASLGPLLGSGEHESKDLPGQAEVFSSNEELDKLISKIAFVCMEIQPKLPDLIQVWIDNGEEGYTRTAFLIDSIMVARERILSTTGAIAPLKIPLDEELARTHEESIAEAYRQIVDMEIEDKIDSLESIYWDLISVRTLGLQSLRRPFDFLQSMPKQNVLELFQTQREEAKALAMIYLPSEMKQEILSELNENEKESIITNMLKQTQISQKQIWDVDTSVKVATIQHASQPTEQLVNLFPRTVEVLHSLRPVDEIKTLRRVAPALPNQGAILKQQYPSLAFLNEWKEDYIRKLVQVSTADEIVNLARVFPESKELLLAECAPKVKSIVNDDLALSVTVDPAAVDAKLVSMKNKWNRIIVAENLPMSRVFKSGKEQGEINAA